MLLKPIFAYFYTIEYYFGGLIAMNKICIYVSLLLSTGLFACTGIFLRTTRGSYVYARTLEFGIPLDSSVLFVPRNIEFATPTPLNKPGLTWKSRYAMVGINVFHTNYVVDGLNEAGLAGGLFYFPGFAEYQSINEENYSKSVPMWALLTWLLTNFDSIDEIKKELPTIYASNTTLPEAGSVGQDTPIHLIVHDIAGKSLVIEYLNGTLHMFDNPIGVLTNAPAFDWHLTNLRNYIKLSPENAPAKEMAGVQFNQLGQGSGMLGMPGDLTPPSRFVRAVTFTQAIKPAATEAEAVHQAFHVLNNFDIPKNMLDDGTEHSDYTTWTSASDMKNKIYYFRPYENFQLHKIDLMNLDLDASATKEFTMQYPEEIIDIVKKNAA